ncbi:MAG: hypothetical protein JST40_13395 [Armatimonadetes bacterium]|nr:hypothetical protein [Armatimonadota bacterium]
MAAPIEILAILEFRKYEYISTKCWVLAIAFPIVLWLLVNFLGLFQNQKMRRVLIRRLYNGRLPDDKEAFFVGVATPGFISTIDPHEDIGFLLLDAKTVEFCGEEIQRSYAQSDVGKIKKGINPHALIGLGGWIVLADKNGKPLLKIEPRERRTLLGNKLFARHFRHRLERWLQGAGPT